MKAWSWFKQTMGLVGDDHQLEPVEAADLGGQHHDEVDVGGAVVDDDLGVDQAVDHGLDRGVAVAGVLGRATVLMKWRG